MQDNKNEIFTWVHADDSHLKSRRLGAQVLCIWLYFDGLNAAKQYEMRVDITNIVANASVNI